MSKIDIGEVMLKIYNQAKSLDFLFPVAICITDKSANIVSFRLTGPSWNLAMDKVNGEIDGRKCPLFPVHYVCVDAENRSFTGLVNSEFFNHHIITQAPSECEDIGEKLHAIRSLLTDGESARLNNLPYNEFLSSEYWRTVAAYVKERDKNCQLCGSDYYLQVHHLTYEHRGKEVNHLQDLTTLCGNCHKAEHGIGRAA